MLFLADLAMARHQSVEVELLDLLQGLDPFVGIAVRQGR